ncbi:A/G-specific adenine glycosylase [Sporolactobacillus kofuensis]|uniref:Adenine DNA glycosylase n=1 Tax=Sporolactobacillus kofuensis TaxID=269672 RepID=A0ABW1WDP4_9BACL|nr:A/G-specific adenine glycosylase [Sporolactobacillus kofuensis]MCO7175305.1 A/G-specific adenine glycosylase [Sporolactobacillus kofuensis]
MDLQTIQSFNHDLLDWFHQEGRKLPWRETSNPYYIWISEVMLQQTQVNTVIPYYERFIKQFPTPSALASASEQEVLKCWEGLGYYSRARHLQEGVREVVEKYDSTLPERKKDLLSITGIGPYTAAALLSIAFNEPEPAIDGNLMRVLSRVFLIDDDISKQKTRKKFEALASNLIIETVPSAFNQALMDLGAMICRPKTTECTECPIQNYCLAYKEGVQLEYPVKTGKAKLRTLNYAVLLITDEHGRYLIEQRPEQGLLAGMWQFPMVALDEYAEQSQREQFIQSRVGKIDFRQQSFTYTHRFSHLIWQLSLFKGQIQEDRRLKEREKWMSLNDMQHYPFPVSHQKVIEWVKKNRQEHT